MLLELIKQKDIEIANLKSVVESIEFNFIKGNPTSYSYLYDKFSNMAIISKVLSKYKFINISIIPSRKWGEIIVDRFVLEDMYTKEVLDRKILEGLVKRYTLTTKYAGNPNLTKVKGKGIIDVGLRRPNMDRQLSKEFYFDVEAIKQFKKEILAHELMSSRDTFGDKSVFLKYPHIISTVIGTYISTPRAYTMGGMISDNRGRAIARQLQAILNPVSSKIGRSLMEVDPIHLDTTMTSLLDKIYRFIVELNGQGRVAKTIVDKALLGRKLYEDRVITPIEEDLHEHIWLTRIYCDLDILFDKGSIKWGIPLEAD